MSGEIYVRILFQNGSLVCVELVICTDCDCRNVIWFAYSSYTIRLFVQNIYETLINLFDFRKWVPQFSILQMMQMDSGAQLALVPTG
jgi:hypothetical protein